VTVVGAQLNALNIVTSVAASTPKGNVPVTITGVLDGDNRTNLGMDADGLCFPVITVSSISRK
jgi:hypothetical protein